MFKFIIIAVFTSLVFTSVSYSLSPIELEDAKKKALNEAEKYKDVIKKENKHKKEGEKRANESYEVFKKEIEPKVKDMRDRMRWEDGKLTIKPEKKDENIYKKDKYLAKNERIYIFISSSIPKTTIKNYAIQMDKIRDANISMVMRGCIGGCKKIMPTVKWIQDIIAPSEEEQLVAEVLIDPNLFKMYDIKTVPAVVYVSGLELENIASSEGVEENIKVKPTAYILYGDTALDFALEKINEKARASSINEMLKELRKTWFQGSKK